MSIEETLEDPDSRNVDEACADASHTINLGFQIVIARGLRLWKCQEPHAFWSH